MTSFGDVNYCSYMFPLPECEKMKQRVSKAEKQATEMERSHQGVFIMPTELYEYEKALNCKPSVHLT